MWKMYLLALFVPFGAWYELYAKSVGLGRFVLEWTCFSLMTLFVLLDLYWGPGTNVSYLLAVLLALLGTHFVPAVIVICSLVTD